MKYIVSVAGREIEVEVDGDQVFHDARSSTATVSTCAV